MVVILPVIAYSLKLNPDQFGIWAGASIQSTAQVISSAALYSDNSVQIAIIIKSLRILLLLPFMLLISFHNSHIINTDGNHRSLFSDYIPPFMIWFVSIVILFNALDYFINLYTYTFIKDIIGLILVLLRSISKICLSLSIFGISYNFNIFSKVNFNPKLIIFSFASSIILIFSNYRLLII